MEFALKVLAKMLIDQGAQVTISCKEKALEQLMQDRCCQALREIRDVLADDTLEDPECFRRIERIVEIYEELGLNTGLRHDF